MNWGMYLSKNFLSAWTELPAAGGGITTSQYGTKQKCGRIRFFLLTRQRTLSWWGVLSDKRQELVLGLLQRDLTGPHRLSQARLEHKVSQFGFSVHVASGKVNQFRELNTKTVENSFHPPIFYPGFLLHSGSRVGTICQA